VENEHNANDDNDDDDDDDYEASGIKAFALLRLIMWLK